MSEDSGDELNLRHFHCSRTQRRCDHRDVHNRKNCTCGMKTTLSKNWNTPTSKNRIRGTSMKFVGQQELVAACFQGVRPPQEARQLVHWSTPSPPPQPPSPQPPRRHQLTPCSRSTPESLSSGHAEELAHVGQQRSHPRPVQLHPRANSAMPKNEHAPAATPQAPRKRASPSRRKRQRCR